jgi:hypothetical protein
MMPSAKTESCKRAPPEKRLIRPKRPEVSAPSIHCLTFVYETPGVGTTEPKRKRAMIERVKKIFFRSSGVLNAIPNALSINLLHSL